MSSDDPAGSLFDLPPVPARGASNVEPAAVDEEPLLQIRVTDNGKGIAGERVGGRGLMNMRSRANKIGGTLALESVAGAGTRVKFTYGLSDFHTGLTRTPTQLGLNTEAIIERFREGGG